MPYKYQGFGGSPPLTPMGRLILGIIFCVIVCAYFSVVAAAVHFDVFGHHANVSNAEQPQKVTK